jgi:hypothetical protein
MLARAAEEISAATVSLWFFGGGGGTTRPKAALTDQSARVN